MGDQGGQSQGQGQGQRKVTGMEKIITNPGQLPVVHFVSGLGECEKKTVVWEVRNIAELLKMSKENLKDSGITFDAGHSIGIPATWYFYFTRFEHWGGRVANYIKLSPDSKAKLVKASCVLSLSCGDETITLAAFPPTEFKNTVTLNGGDGCLGAWPLTAQSHVLQKTQNGNKKLTVTLTLKVFSSKESESEGLESPKPGVLENDAVISDLEKLLESGDGADVDVTVPSVFGGDVEASSYTRKVHKTILMGRSTVFSRMFAKESEMVESKTGKVVIKDLSPQGLGVFLHYIYTGKVLDEWVNVPEEVLNCAEKYDLGRLKNYCGRNLMSAVTTKNAWEMFQLAKLHKLSFAKNAIAEFVSKNAKAVLTEGTGGQRQRE